MAEWLPEEFKEDAAVNKFKEPVELVKAYKEAQSFIGQSIRIPSENAGEADINAFREKLKTKIPSLVDAKDEKGLARAFGVPEKAEEYTISEEAKFSEAETKAFRERAQALGLSKKQADVALKAELEARTKAATAVKENLAAVEKEWGAGTKERLDKIATVAERFGFDKEWVQGVRDGKVPLNALNPFYKMMSAIGAEGGELGKNNSSTSSKPTPEEAERQLAELSKNPAFLNPKDPTHQHLQKEFMRLVALTMGHDKVPEPYIEG